MNQIKLLGRSFAGADLSGYKIVKSGCIVYTKSPLSIFPYGIIKRAENIEGIVSTLYSVYDVSIRFDGRFIENYFALPSRANSYLKPLVRIGAKHTMQIGNNEFISHEISFPSLNEQKKICDFISLIDQRIAIQNKTIAHYESLIRALATAVIGANKPNTQIVNVVDCSSSTLKESDLDEAGTVPTYGAAGLSGYTDVCLSVRDSILITKDGSGVGSLRYVRGSHSFVGTLNSLTPKEGIYLPYIYYALRNVNFDSYKTGQAIPHIYFKDYGKEKIYCPTYDEQIRLAKPLELIDTKIEREKEMSRKLQSLKAYLLAGLFI